MYSSRCLVAAVVLGLALWSCDSRKSPLVSFSDSGCKGHLEDGALSYLYAPLDAADYPGLQCISYGLTEAGLAVDLFNFSSACGPEWEGVAAVDGAAVTVGVTNPGCLLAACGSCIYDWALEVEGVVGGADIDLTISVEACPGEQAAETETLSLPAETLEQGLLCRYASWGTLEWLGLVGTLNTPCGDSEMLEEPIVCAGDLECAPVGEDGREICVQPCADVSDCPLPETMLCDDAGRCVLDPAVGW
jgi:hypothetical protein